LYFGPFTYIYICSGFFPKLVAKLPKGLDWKIVKFVNVLA
jgi:hypothetical protein